MTNRLYLGFLSGSPVFRISKPGKDVSSANIADFVLREDSNTLRPATTGNAVFSGSATINISLSSFGFAAPPYVTLDSSDQFAPHFFDYYAKLNDTFTTLSIVNVRNIARTITYFVFANTW